MNANRRRRYPPEGGRKRAPERPAAGRVLTPALLLGLCWSLAQVQAAPPEITVRSPHALRPDAAAMLVVKGKGLASARALWTSWGGTRDRNDAEGWQCLEESARIPVFIPASHPAGLEAIRILGTNGVSNLAWILVDGLPIDPALQGKAPTSRDAARLLHPPVAVDGVCAESGSRYYRLRMEQGQQVSLEVVAQRMGFPVDPVLRVLDADGAELAYVHDTPGLGADAALAFQAPTTGDFVVEVRDGEFAGGAAQRYRLRVGAFAVGVLPDRPALGATPGADRQESEIPWESSVAGWSGMARARGIAASSVTTRFARLRLAGRTGSDALMPRLAWMEGRVETEQEPNNTAASATVVAAGGTMSGGFQAAGDEDWFRFSVRTSGWWRIQARSRSLGWAGDPQLRLADADGKPLASAMGGDPDPSIFRRLAGPAAYLVSVTEAARRQGPGRGYLLEVEPSAAAFRISTEIERMHIPVGGKQGLKLKIESRGYDGPIRIEAENLPAGFELENPQIEDRKKEWELGIRCRADVTPGGATLVRFRARPTGSDGGEGTAWLDLGPAQRKAFPRMLSMPPGFMDGVWVAAIDHDVDPP